MLFEAKFEKPHQCVQLWTGPRGMAIQFSKADKTESYFWNLLCKPESFIKSAESALLGHQYDLDFQNNVRTITGSFQPVNGTTNYVHFNIYINGWSMMEFRYIKRVEVEEFIRKIKDFWS